MIAEEKIKKMTKCGGWMVSAEPGTCDLPKEVKSAFNEATDGWVGSEFKVISYIGHQLVNGMNYKLICKATWMTATFDEHMTIMTIHKPREGNAEMMSIETII